MFFYSFDYASVTLLLCYFNMGGTVYFTTKLVAILVGIVQCISINLIFLTI